MINITSKVFDTVYNAVHLADKTADVIDVAPERFAKFPAVVVRESNNIPMRNMNTDDNSENYTRISYEVNVYTDNQTAAKAKADMIFEAVDQAMKSLKFYRSMTRRLPNQDRTIYRMYGRYEVIVQAPQEINGATVYQMYRR